MRRIVAFALVPLLLLTGCAARGAEGLPSTTTSPTPTPWGHYMPDNIVFTIEEGGGFVGPATMATELPHVIVYGDGRVIIGPTSWNDRWVGLPHLRQYMIGPDGIRQLVSLAWAAGVGRDDIDYGFPLVADVPTTSFRVLTSMGLLSTHVYALEYDEGLDPAMREARQKLIDLQEALTDDISSTLGADVAGPASTYQPRFVAVVSRPWGDSEPSAERTWPGPALPGQPLPLNPIVGEDDLSCVVATGDDIDPVTAEGDAATEETAWLWEGQRYRIWFRPLLPHESSCADL